MTTVTGSWVPNSTTNQRMQLILDYTVPTPAIGASSITVTGSVKVKARYFFSDSGNVFTRSGTLLGGFSKSVNVSIGSNDGTQTLDTFSVSVPLGSSTSTKTLSYSLSGIEYVGASSKATVSATLQIPAKRVSSPPATPSYINATRISDTEHNITWTPGDDTHDGFELQWWSAATGKWATLGEPRAGARSWLTKSTTSNQRYQWRIRARNSAGVSAWATSPFRRTTPAAASNVTATRSGDGFALSWTVNAKHATHQDVQVSTSSNGSTWSAWANIAGFTQLGAAVTSATVPGTTSAYHRFRIVSAVGTEVDGASLYGYSPASNSIAPLAPPNAPTIVAPHGVTLPVGQPVIPRWKHRPVDGSAQTAAEVRYRQAGETAWTTVTVTGSAYTYQIPGDPAAGEYEWQVRTKGDHASYSAWSSTATFTIAERATVTITEPGDTVNSNVVWVRVLYVDPQLEAARSSTFELLQGGQVIESRTVNYVPSVYRMRTLLNDGETYTVRVRATSGAGLATNTATQTFTVEFTRPYPPYLAAEWIDGEGAVSLTVDNTQAIMWGNTGETWGTIEGTWAAPGGTYSPAVTNRIERSIDGGQTWMTLGELPLNGGMVDDTAPLGSNILYRAVAISALNVENASPDALVATGKCHAWITSPGGRFAITWNPSFNAAHSQEQRVVRYFGRQRPTSHYGLGRSTIVNVDAAELADDDIGFQQQWEPVLYGYDVLYRDPTGLTITATVVSGPEYRQESPDARTLSMTLEAVDG